MAHAEHVGAVKNAKKWIFNHFTVVNKSAVLADFCGRPSTLVARLTIRKGHTFLFWKSTGIGSKIPLFKKKWIFNHFTVFNKSAVLADFCGRPSTLGARLTIKKGRTLLFWKSTVPAYLYLADPISSEPAWNLPSAVKWLPLANSTSLKIKLPTNWHMLSTMTPSKSANKINS